MTGEKWLETLRLRCALMAVRAYPRPKPKSLVSNPRFIGGGGNGILVTCLGLEGATRGATTWTEVVDAEAVMGDIDDEEGDGDDMVVEMTGVDGDVVIEVVGFDASS